MNANLGWSLFWRASKRCWVLAYKSVDGWAQKQLPKEIGRDDGPRKRKRKPSGARQLDLPVTRAETWATEWLTNAEALKLRPRARPGGLVLRVLLNADLHIDDHWDLGVGTMKRAGWMKANNSSRSSPDKSG